MPKRDGTKKALVRRVKKAVKKSRRRLGAEKFEKELTRTITFLENLQRKLSSLPAPKVTDSKANGKPAGKPSTKPATKPKTKPSAKKPAPGKATVTAASPASRVTSAAKRK